MIKVIVFDLGGVCFTDGTEVLLQKVYKRVSVPKEIVDGLFRGRANTEGWLYRKGKMTPDEFWDAVAKKLAVGMKDAVEIRKLWLSSYKPIPGMKNIVAKLRKNYKVVVFSGTMKERMDYLEEKYEVRNDFDDFVLSFETGFHKNEKEAYEILLERIGCRPDECVLIDDKEIALDFARQFGMKTVLFRNPEQLKAEFVKMCVVV